MTGLPRPRLDTAADSTRRNSWSRRILLRSLSGSWGQARGFLLVTPGPLYCRCRARTTSSAWKPLSWWHPAVGHVQPRVGVVHGLGEVHLDPTEGVDHTLEAVEVELHVVVDRDPEVLLDGAHELLGSLDEGGVDLVGPVGTGVGDEEVAGDRQDGGRLVVRVEVQDHHHVAVHAGDTLRAQAERLVLLLERTPRRGPHQDDVLDPRGRHGHQVADLDARDLVVAVLDVADADADQHDDHGDHHDAHSEQALRHALAALGRGCRRVRIRAAVPGGCFRARQASVVVARAPAFVMPGPVVGSGSAGPWCQ